MPRFLNTRTGEFECHEARRVPYAILSHTWTLPGGGGEQSYDDIVRLQNKIKELRKNSQLPASDTLSARPDDTTNAYLTIFSHPDLSEKIKGICEVAREAGFRLLWLDSCCINKESSAELSEAINSMYEWYRLADVCYVYLADVPDGKDPTAGEPRSPFRSSRWHQRGWTLQELLAPKRVVFLTRTWRFLGTKMGLASTLEDITGIDFDVLTGTASLDSVSVARRMSWAAQRETARVEDRAYSLMGIFGVHLSPIYGEGHHAFIRLQEEILQRIPDQSILAWGMSCTLLSLTQGETNWRGGSTPHLLADSPGFFRQAGDIVPLSSSGFAERLGLEKTAVPSIRYGFTPSGVCTHLLCIDITPTPELFDQFYKHVGQKPSDNCRAHCAHSLALLQCEDKTGSIVALPLCRPHVTSKGDWDNLETLRRVGISLEGLVITTHPRCNAMSESPFHTIRLTEEALADILRKPLPITLTKVLLSHSQPDVLTPKSREWGFARCRGIAFRTSNSQFGVAFSLAPVCIEELRALGYDIAPLQCTRSSDEIAVTTSLTSTSQCHAGRRSTFKQTIELRLAFNVPMERYGTAITSFIVTSVVHNHPSAPHSTTPVLVIPGASQRSRNETEGSSQMDGLEGRWVSEFFSESTTERVLVDAEFIICTDVDERTSDEPNARLLRVALERPLWSREVADDRNLHIFVELSQAYTYRFSGRHAVRPSGKPTISAAA